MSFRSVPRIIRSFQDKGFDRITWIPHFTSIINWTIRVGLGLLNKVAPIEEPWLALMDFSFDIGIRKILLVLRVPVSALEAKGTAISAGDCQCIGVKIAEGWNGERVHEALTEIFDIAGTPTAIVKDNGSDIGKGVRLWRESHRQVPVIEDIGHITANALKKNFENSRLFKRFIKIITKGASRLRQTTHAALIPPKIRSKGRFQSISRVAHWAIKFLTFIEGPGRSAPGERKHKLQNAFAGLSLLRPFIERFLGVCMVTDDFQKILKDKGLNQSTYRLAQEKISQLGPNCKVRKRLQKWLTKVISIHCRLSIGQVPLLVSTDIVESIFGKFKIMIQRHPKAELNRLALVLPAICHHQNEDSIKKALATISHKDLLLWEKENLPTTQRIKRRQQFGDARSCKKVGQQDYAATG